MGPCAKRAPPHVQGEAESGREVARIASLTQARGPPFPRFDRRLPKPVPFPMQPPARPSRAVLSAALAYNDSLSYSFTISPFRRAFGGGHPDDTAVGRTRFSTDRAQCAPSLCPRVVLPSRVAAIRPRGSPDWPCSRSCPVVHPADNRATQPHLQISGSFDRVRTGPQDVPWGHRACRCVRPYQKSEISKAGLALYRLPRPKCPYNRNRVRLVPFLAVTANLPRPEKGACVFVNFTRGCGAMECERACNGFKPSCPVRSAFAAQNADPHLRRWGENVQRPGCKRLGDAELALWVDAYVMAEPWVNSPRWGGQAAELATDVRVFDNSRGTLAMGKKIARAPEPGGRECQTSDKTP